MAAARWPWPGSSATRPARRMALRMLAIAASYGGDHDGAVQLARQAAADHRSIPGSIARMGSTVTGRGADRGRGPGGRRAVSARRRWPSARDAGDLLNLAVPADVDGGPGPAVGRHRGRRRAPARSTPDRSADRRLVRADSTAWSTAGICAPQPGAPPRPSRYGPPRCPRPRSGGMIERTARRTRAGGRKRCARPGMRSGPAERRAAEERGAAMSLATAAEYALMLTAARPAAGHGGHRTGAAQRPGTGAGHPGRPGPHRTRRSPRSCTSASAPSARTWTGSGTRPAAAAAPT